MTERKYKSIFDYKKLLAEEEAKNKSEEDDDQNFIKKDEPQEEQSQEKEEEKSKTEEAQEQSFFGKLFNKIFPKANQNRNLDDEIGGLEAKEDKGISQKDAWDNRSEEVDKMGSTNTFETTGMRSVVWRQKRARLAAKKIAKHALNAAEAKAEIKAETKKSGMAPSSFDNQGFVSRLRNLKQDRSSGFGKDEGR
jgi:hypothetical protein